MQTDFHFYCVSVLARAAGFTPDDALVLGYASQYVDDATEGDLIPIKVNGGEFRFDPVRTCYDGLAAVETLGWSGEKKVFIPFHYLPPEVFNPVHSPNFTFVTDRNRAFSKLLLENALREPKRNRERRLCRMGVALHTFADTWAHSDFTGRMHGDENGVASIRVYDREGKEIPSKIENLVYRILPRVGHGEALLLPDIAYKTWECMVGSPGRSIRRDNVECYLNCAEEIYKWLCSQNASRKIIPWKTVAPRIERLFGASCGEPGVITRLLLPLYYGYSQKDLDRRCEKWKAEFGDLFKDAARPYSYDKTSWREEALDGNVQWDDYSRKKWSKVSAFSARSGFWNSLWVHFHRAALKQRNFVLENLP